MKIVFAASEMRPFSKTGGLGEAIEGLARSLHNAGHEVKVFLPYYQETRNRYPDLKKAADLIIAPVGQNQEHGRLLVMDHAGIEVFFIEQPYYYERPALYGDNYGDFEDNDRRYIFFARGVLEGLRKIRYASDILHAHDWHAGLIPAYLKTLYQNDPLFKKTRTVFTIHNIAYQGNFARDSFNLTNLSWEEYRFDRMEFYGQVSFLKAGIVYSDFVTTVSGEHAREVREEPAACGFASTLRGRQDSFIGILNGIDTESWDPAKNKEIAGNYSAEDPKGKAVCKKALQKEAGFAREADIPLLGFIGRLSVQKGVDILLPLLKELSKLRAQFVFLGTGGVDYEYQLKALCAKNRKTMKAFVAFDTALARRIYSGCDIFMMPSLYEPCGLGQLLAMRYGAVPLVRATGGLKETVQDFDPKRGKGTGIVFQEYSEKGLSDSIERAIELYGRKEAWSKLIQNCLKMDFSWTKQAKKYISVYNSLLK